MLNIIISVFLTLAADVSVVVQQALSANLRAALGSAVGLACMAVPVLAFRDPLPSAAAAARIPWGTCLL